MSDEHSLKWKSVDKSLKKILIDMPSVKAMSKEEWHNFLRFLKEDKQGVSRMHKLIQASGDSKRSQFHDSATSGLGNFLSDKEKSSKKEEATKTERPDAKAFVKAKTNLRLAKEKQPVCVELSHATPLAHSLDINTAGQNL